jgi:hypothetical protein
MGCGIHPPDVMAKVEKDDDLIGLNRRSRVTYVKAPWFLGIFET